MNGVATVEMVGQWLVTLHPGQKKRNIELMESVNTAVTQDGARDGSPCSARHAFAVLLVSIWSCRRGDLC